MSFQTGGSFGGSPKDLFTPAQIQHLMRVEFDRAQRYRYPLVMLVIGVDRLAQLQDLYGAEVKDEIQRGVAGVLRTSTRASDSLGYLIDDKIVVLVPHTPSSGAAVVARRVIESVRNLRFDCDGRTTRVTVSIGGAHNNRKGELAFGTLLEVAEAGLRVAREGGGNRYVHSDLYEFFERKRSQEAARIPPPLPSTPGGEVALGALGDRIRELFGLGQGDDDLLGRIQREVVASALREVHEQVRRTLPSETREQAERIELLERRIATLSESLGMTEAELRRVLAQRPTDSGVASAYKNVQGLSAAAVQAELKKALMSKIFEANVELQRQLSAQPKSPS
ncbi:MAG: GGDEF domain-containing protein [Planctomycetes bacterium]|nr:GGDEF domain-containing protein [Planctomycetota bacterium]